ASVGELRHALLHAGGGAGRHIQGLLADIHACMKLLGGLLVHRRYPPLEFVPGSPDPEPSSTGLANAGSLAWDTPGHGRRGCGAHLRDKLKGCWSRRPPGHHLYSTAHAAELATFAAAAATPRSSPQAEGGGVPRRSLPAPPRPIPEGPHPPPLARSISS